MIQLLFTICHSVFKGQSVKLFVARWCFCTLYDRHTIQRSPYTDHFIKMQLMHMVALISWLRTDFQFYSYVTHVK